tara:strand:- start:113 stop:241 length:129 start_codon:yes stop_codon:yes gene_type:complete
MLTELKKARILAYLTKQIRKDKHFLKKFKRKWIRECLSEEKI